MELALDTPLRLRAVPQPATPNPVPLPNEATDTELLVRVADRDRAAFELLYHRYVRSMFGLALRRLRDRQRAEDAFQETFAAVWRSAGSSRPRRGPAAPRPSPARATPRADPTRGKAAPVDDAAARPPAGR